MSKKRVIFLDRDGTLNQDPGYLSDSKQLTLLPGVTEGLHALREMGYFFVVVSNQSGIGRGLITEQELRAVNNRLLELLGETAKAFLGFKMCIHHPLEQCSCRKPSPELIFQSIREYNVDPHASYMVGDRISDLEAGWNAGLAGSVLVLTGHGHESAQDPRAHKACVVVSGLVGLAEYLRSIKR